MPELETSALPPLSDNSDPDMNGASDEADADAPYGRNKDGTPAKKRGRKPGSTGGGRRTSQSDEEFASRISQELVELSAPIAVISPLAMAHVADRADRTAKALTVIGRKHPAVKSAIIAYFDSVAYKDLAFFVIGIPIAIAMDYGMIRPDSRAGYPFGFAEKWEELYGNDLDGPEAPPNNTVEARGLAGMVE